MQGIAKVMSEANFVCSKVQACSTVARQEFGNLWTLRGPQPSDSSIYLYLTLEVFQTYDKK